MTGNEFVAGAAIVAGCFFFALVPAFLVFVYRKLYFKSGHGFTLIGSFFVAISLYVISFFLAWIFGAVILWDGESKMYSIVSRPFAMVFVLISYSFVMGLMLEFFSVFLPVEGRSPWHHLYLLIFAFTFGLFGVLYADKIYSWRETEAKFSTKSTDATFFPMPSEFYGPCELSSSEKGRIGQFNAVADRGELLYSPINPDSHNFDMRVVDRVEGRLLFYGNYRYSDVDSLRLAIRDSTGVWIGCPPVED